MINPANLLDVYREAVQSNLAAALATVVRVVGSAYRRPGARMLVLSDGRTFGSISGGCLERDVAIRSQALINQGLTSLLQYSTMGSDDDIVFGLGLGCNGSVEILVEPLVIPEQLEVLKHVKLSHDQRRPIVVGTVFGGSGQSRLGTALVVDGNGIFITNDLAPSVSDELLSIAQRAYALGCSETVSLSEESAVQLDVFIEYVQPPIKLIICGAGADAVPVSAIAKQVGWNVEVIDHRPEYALTERFPAADNVLCGGPDDILHDIQGCVRTAMLIMTHNYSRDLDYLKRALVSDVDYIGLLGPRQRTLRLLQELKTEGVAYTSEQLARLYAPVGLDLGAENEQEIALSAVSEVQAAMSSRRGGFLRDRNGPIHSGVASALAAEKSLEHDPSKWSTIQCPLD